MRTKVNLCTCLNCDSILIDTNAKPDAKLYDIDKCPCDILIDNNCPNCLTDEYLTDIMNEKRLAPLNPYQK